MENEFYDNFKTPGSVPDSTLAPVEGGKYLLAALAAWLVPGAGYLVLRKYGKALTVFLLLSFCFIYGGNYAAPNLKFRNITPQMPAHFVAQLGYGLPSLALGLRSAPDPKTLNAIKENRNFELGMMYLDVGGLLNYLIIIYLLLMEPAKEEERRRAALEASKTTGKIPNALPAFSVPKIPENPATPEAPVIQTRQDEGPTLADGKPRANPDPGAEGSA